MLNNAARRPFRHNDINENSIPEFTLSRKNFHGNVNAIWSFHMFCAGNNKEMHQNVTSMCKAIVLPLSLHKFPNDTFASVSSFWRAETQPEVTLLS